MTSMVATATTPTLDGISRKTLLQQLGLVTGLLSHGTITDATVEYIEDTVRLKSYNSSPTDIQGWVRISSSNDHAAPEGEIRAIVNTRPEMARIEIDPPFSVAPQANEEYEIWKVHPKFVLDMIDRVLTEDLYFPVWSMLSEVPDFDMEQSHTTDWTSSNATVTKQTGEPKLSSTGRRYLRVVSTAAGGYAKSATLTIIPGQSYHMSAVVRCGSGATAKLQAYDETNGAEIASVTSDNRMAVRLHSNFSAPIGCHQITIRLINVENSVTTEWDEVVAFGGQSSDIACPWWMRKKDQIKGVFVLEPITADTDAWEPALIGHQDTAWDIIESRIGGSKFRAVNRYSGMLPWPLYIYGVRNETAYSDDTTDLKYLNLDLFLECLKWRVYSNLTEPLISGLLDAKSFKAKAAESLIAYRRLQNEQDLELNQVLRSPTPYGQFLNPRFDYGEY